MQRIFLVGSGQTKHIQKLLASGERRFFAPRGSGWRGRLDMALGILRADRVYVVGNFSERIVRFAGLCRKKLIIHWIGTDVYNYLRAPRRLRVYDHAMHLACSPLLRQELASVGIRAQFIPIVPQQLPMELQSVPPRHAALAYIPQGKETFYHAELVTALAARHPDIPFYIVANKGFGTPAADNVIFCGTLDAGQMEEMYRKISVLVRLPEHDGLSLMLMEALAKGKQVVYRYEHPGAVAPASMDIDAVDRAFCSVIEKAPELNLVGHDYVLEHYAPEKIQELYSEYHVLDL